jgi:hypothetical protein
VTGAVSLRSASINLSSRRFTTISKSKSKSSHHCPLNWQLCLGVAHCQSEVKVTLRLTVSQSVILGVEPHLGLMTRYIYYSLTVTALFFWGDLSDERMGLSSVYAADPRQHSFSRVRVSWDSSSQSHIATDGQSISKPWCRTPFGGSWPDIYYCLTVTVWCLLGALSDERTGLSFIYVDGPRQSSLSRVRVPWDSWPYFNVSDLRLPFSSSPTTRRVTVEVFEPAWFCKADQRLVPWLGTDRIENTASNGYHIVVLAYCHVSGVTWLIIVDSRFDDWIYLTSLLQLHWIIKVHTFISWMMNLSLLPRYCTGVCLTQRSSA